MHVCMHMHACTQSRSVSQSVGVHACMCACMHACACMCAIRLPPTAHPQIWDMCNNFREEKTFYGHQRWVWDAVFSAETPPTNPNPTFTPTST